MRTRPTRAERSDGGRVLMLAVAAVLLLACRAARPERGAAAADSLAADSVVLPDIGGYVLDFESSLALTVEGLEQMERHDRVDRREAGTIESTVHVRADSIALDVASDGTARGERPLEIVMMRHANTDAGECRVTPRAKAPFRVLGGSVSSAPDGMGSAPRLVIHPGLVALDAECDSEFWGGTVAWDTDSLAPDLEAIGLPDAFESVFAIVHHDELEGTPPRSRYTIAGWMPASPEEAARGVVATRRDERRGRREGTTVVERTVFLLRRTRGPAR